MNSSDIQLRTNSWSQSTWVTIKITPLLRFSFSCHSWEKHLHHDEVFAPCLGRRLLLGLFKCHHQSKRVYWLLWVSLITNITLPFLLPHRERRDVILRPGESEVLESEGYTEGNFVEDCTVLTAHLSTLWPFISSSKRMISLWASLRMTSPSGG